MKWLLLSVKELSKIRMNLFFCFIFSFALNAASFMSASVILPEKLAQKLHVCTVASKLHPNLEKLIISCEKYGIQLEVLGMGKPYRSNMDKLKIMRKYCHQLPDNDLVLFIDAFDVLVLADKCEMVSRFLTFDVPMLMSMEMNCWPSSETAAFHPPTDSVFKYINTGGYIGWVKAVRQWLDAFDKSLLSGTSDQAAAHKLYAKKNQFYALDHWCAIFLCLYQVPFDAILIDEDNQKIICSYTNSSPCVLHANGGSFHVWNQVYSLFFDNSQKGLERNETS